MTQQVRVGIIGTSPFVDGYHVPWLKSHPRAVLAAICGRRQARAEEVAKKHAIPRVFTDYRAMIEQADLDAVVIVTPDNMHYPMTLCALDAGLHVLCEKPLARSALEAREMLEKAQRAGVKHMTFFTWRWMPHYQYLKQLVDSGYIGRCFDCHIRYMAGYARDGAYYSWRFDRNIGTGVLGDLGTHAIDFARYFVGEIRQVSCHLTTFVERSASHTPDPANDSAVLALEFANGAHATLHVSAAAHLAERGQEQQISLYGEKGSIEAVSTDGSWQIRGAQQNDDHFQLLAVPDDLWGAADRNNRLDVFYKQPVGDRLFIDAILEDRPAVPGFYDGLKAQEVIDAALKSHETGCWVSLPDAP